MKKLRIQPGEHSCTWAIGDAKVGGELVLAGDRRARGTVFDAPDPWTTESPTPGIRIFSPHTVNLPQLRGWLRSGEDIVLLDVTVRHAFPGHAWLSARLALCGLGISTDEQPLFDTASFQVGGLTELSGTTALSQIRLPPTSATGDYDFGARSNTNANQQWLTNSGDTLSLKYVFNVQSDRGYGYEVSSYPMIEVRGEPRTADDWMNTYVQPLAQIATFATAAKQSVCWVELAASETSPYVAQLFAADLTQEPYDAQTPDPGALAPFLQLGASGTSLAEVLSRWQSVREGYDTFFDYLTTSLREEMTAKSRFLALMPAIESYHTAKYGDGPAPRAEFRRARKALLLRLRDNDGVDTADVQWLERWVDTIGSYQLHDRLRALLAELEPPLQDRLLTRTQPLPTHLDGILENPTDIWHVMGKARNNLAHGGPHPTQEQLVTLTRLAHTLAIGLMLQHLGASTDPLTAAIDQEQWAVL